jgi:hypothetical protein
MAVPPCPSSRSTAYREAKVLPARLGMVAKRWARQMGVESEFDRRFGLGKGERRGLLALRQRHA